MSAWPNHTRQNGIWVIHLRGHDLRPTEHPIDPYIIQFTTEGLVPDDNCSTRDALVGVST